MPAVNEPSSSDPGDGEEVPRRERIVGISEEGETAAPHFGQKRCPGETELEQEVHTATEDGPFSVRGLEDLATVANPQRIAHAGAAAAHRKRPSKPSDWLLRSSGKVEDETFPRARP